MTNSDKSIAQITLGRSLPGTIGGIAAVVLCILGLAGIYPLMFVSISVIAIGAALVFRGGVIAAEFSKLAAHFIGSKESNAELGGGASIELLAGIAGIVLGILSLLGFDANLLASIAIIVFGSALMMGSGVLSRLNSIKMSIANPEHNGHRMIEDLVSAATGTQILVGLAAIVLGILALIGLHTLTLNLVALLGIGAAILLSGSAITGKMIGLIRHS